MRITTSPSFNGSSEDRLRRGHRRMSAATMTLDAASTGIRYTQGASCGSDNGYSQSGAHAGLSDDTCPICRRQHALIALGARLDRARRWRPWIVVRTELYLCGHCDALLGVQEGLQGSARMQ